MKKTLFLLTVTALIFLSACKNTKKKTNETNQKIAYFNDNAIHVYYFHYSIRCEGCIAVEEETKNILNRYYPEKMKKKEIIFQAFNMDKNEDKGLSKKLKVGGQTLLFIKNDKIIDLTNDAFLYASYSPDKYEKIVKATISDLSK